MILQRKGDPRGARFTRYLSPRWAVAGIAAALASGFYSHSGTIASLAHAQSEPPFDSTLDAPLVPVEPGGLRAQDVGRWVAAAAPAVDAAQRAVDEAATWRDTARATLWPRLDLSASYTRRGEVELPPFEIMGQAFDSPFPQILNAWTNRATLTIPLSDLLLRAWPAYETTGRGIEAAELQRDAQVLAAEWQGREAFHQWVLARATAQIAEQSAAILAELVSNVEALAAAGVVPTMDVITTRAGLERARTGHAQAELAVDLTARAVAILAGRDDALALTIGESFETDDVGALPDASTLVGEALARRPEGRALAVLTDLRTREARVVRAARYPSVQLQGNVLYANPNPLVVPPRATFDPSWDVGVSVAWSPNDTLRARSDEDRAAIAIDRVDDDRRAFELGVRIEVEEALQQWAAARVAMTGARVQIAALDTELTARLRALQGGIGTTTDVLDAQQRLASARLDLLSAGVSLHRARSRMARVTANPAWLAGASTHPHATAHPGVTR